jgi:hypothetical protein
MSSVSKQNWRQLSSFQPVGRRVPADGSDTISQEGEQKIIRQ